MTQGHFNATNFSTNLSTGFWNPYVSPVFLIYFSLILTFSIFQEVLFGKLIPFDTTIAHLFQGTCY